MNWNEIVGTALFVVIGLGLGGLLVYACWEAEKELRAYAAEVDDMKRIVANWQRMNEEHAKALGVKL